MQNLRFVSSAVPEILWGSQNLKSRSHDQGHAPLFTFFYLVSFLRSICMQNLRFVSSAVPEILWGSQNLKVGHVTRATTPFHNFSFFDLVSLTINPHAKFEVCIFSRSRYIRGSQNLKSRSLDQGHAPFWPIFHFFGLVSLSINLHANLKFVPLAVSEILGGPKFEK